MTCWKNGGIQILFFRPWHAFAQPGSFVLQLGAYLSSLAPGGCLWEVSGCASCGLLRVALHESHTAGDATIPIEMSVVH